MSDLDKFDYECQNQMSIFDLIREQIRITKPIMLIELFAGYGSQAMALERIGAKFEHYRVVEFDKYAVASYNAVHGTDFPTMDITKVHADDLNICNTEAFTYLLTYSFPCTDLSVAGKQAGMKKGSGTRSGLLWEVERILKEIRDGGGELPQILFMENVPQVHADANMVDFQNWIDFLTSLGYVSYWQDLNAKNYGVAQNRERCFMFSFLGEYNYHFPQPIPLKKKLKDYLEDDVDEKYYINNEKAEKLIKQLIDNGTLLSGAAMLLLMVLVILISFFLEHVLNVTFMIEPSLSSQLAAGALLWLSFCWQIPWCLLLAQTLGRTVMLILHLVLYNVMAILVSLLPVYMFFPGALAARMMCPVLGILPNGLPAQSGAMTFTQKLMDSSSIPVGIAASILWFLLLWGAGRIYYERRMKRA